MKFILKIAFSICITIFIASCGKDETGSVKTYAKIMLIHTSPNAASIDVYDDTSKVNNTSISYPNSTDYLSIVTGNKTLTIKQGGTATNVFSTASFSFVKDKYYSLFIVDSLSKISALRLEDNLATPASGKTNFRILHLSPNTPNVDFILRSGPDSIAITNKTFKQIPDLLAVDGKTYTVRVKLAGTQTVVTTQNNVSLNNGKTYTIFLKGFSGGVGASAIGVQLIENN